MKGGVIVAKKKVTNGSETIQRTMPALSEEGQEKRMIAAATNLAYEQILNGTASSQVITHYLKLGTEKYRCEMEKLKAENEMLKAKTEAIQSVQRIEELYKDAMDAMSLYSGEAVEKKNE